MMPACAESDLCLVFVFNPSKPHRHSAPGWYSGLASTKTMP